MSAEDTKKGVESWKAEFYSPVKECNQEAALAHSLKKWEGLTSENLQKHDMQHEHASGDIYEGCKFVYETKFAVDARTCALCHFHLEDDEDEDGNANCETCPLSRLMGKNYGCQAHYKAWQQSADPRPMITLLRQAIKVRNEIA